MFKKLVFAGLAMIASVSASAAGFHAQAGKIYDAAGNHIQIRGISHFGFNDGILQPEYLWAMGWKDQIAQIKSLGFNAVRVPFVPDTLYVTTPVDKLSYVDPNRNPDLLGKTPLQVLDLWMAEADRQGLYVMLDFHSVSKVRQYQTWFVSNPADFNLIYSNQAYTKDMWIRDLKFVAQRYASNPHFMAIDVFNEPNGPVRWSTGDPNQTNTAYYWKAAVESAAAGILAVNPNLLIFVQGIAGNFDGVEDSNQPMNWGEDFQPEAYQPLNIAADKLVLTPHTYGPDVYVKSSFGAPNFPANLPANWDALFGKLYPAHPVIVGEWGGKYGAGTGGPMDVTWQNAFVQYLIGKGISDSFFWCYTPNSGDTGGILDDNLQVRTDKMALIRKLWAGSGTTPPPVPTPTPVPVASAGTLALGVATYAVKQIAGSVTLTVTRASGSSGAISVRYATANGTAVAGRDYTARSGIVSFAAGDLTAKSIIIPVSKLTPFSGTRSFRVTLASPTNAAKLGTPSAATVTITGSATVTTPAPTPAPTTSTSPYITSWGPVSGRAGTVVTINGSGFTGINQAWAGAARDAAVAVVSDTQVRVTIPADATTGAIGISNPAGWAFTPSAFTVTP